MSDITVNPWSGLGPKADESDDFVCSINGGRNDVTVRTHMKVSPFTVDRIDVEVDNIVEYDDQDQKDPVTLILRTPEEVDKLIANLTAARGIVWPNESAALVRQVVIEQLRERAVYPAFARMRRMATWTVRDFNDAAAQTKAIEESAAALLHMVTDAVDTLPVAVVFAAEQLRKAINRKDIDKARKSIEALIEELGQVGPEGV